MMDHTGYIEFYNVDDDDLWWLRVKIDTNAMVDKAGGEQKQ